MLAEKTLQERIGEEANKHTGEQYHGQCGDFVREVLAICGVEVKGRLRDFGTEVGIEQRMAGDVLLFYTNLKNYRSQVPYRATILTGQENHVGVLSAMISEGTIKLKIRNSRIYGRYTDSSGSYVRIRRMQG